MLYERYWRGGDSFFQRGYRLQRPLKRVCFTVAKFNAFDAFVFRWRKSNTRNWCISVNVSPTCNESINQSQQILLSLCCFCSFKLACSMMLSRLPSTCSFFFFFFFLLQGGRSTLLRTCRTLVSLSPKKKKKKLLVLR